MTYYTSIKTPAGEMLLIGNSRIISGLHWKTFKRCPVIQPDWVEDRSVFKEVMTQLDDYFAGNRKTFDIAVEARGTEFQKKVWSELATIGFGEHSSYRAIANKIGKPKAVRAVGTAVGSNPLSILVPCHRVLTSDNRLGGYAGGLASKEVLLRNEGIVWK